MKKVALLFVVCVACLAGCPAPAGLSVQTGSLLVSFSGSELAARTIVPPISVDVSYYGISGSGPSGAMFSQAHVTTTVSAQNSLAVGAWLIVVDAFNANDVLIGSGSTGVSVQAGATTEATVVVAPLSGSGSLSINITWPSGVISNPVVSGTLTPVGGSAQTVPFSMGTASASCSLPSLNAGYYSMALQLSDGAALKWGGFEAVRILKDQTTTAAFSLTLQDINSGGVSLTISPTLQNPIAITLTGQQAQLPLGSDMTVTASPSDPVDSCQWYLNGGLLAGATSSSITLGSSLGVGHYRLDVAVTKGKTVSSTSVGFQVDSVSVSQLISQITESGIFTTASDLQAFGTREVGYQGNVDAGTYVYNRFAAISGLSVVYQGGSLRNVVATLPGSDGASGAVWMVGAHYDSISSIPTDAPGATDNGCGVGIVFELARIMSKYHYKDTLKFACWNSEEQGEIGSQAYAVEAKQNHEDIRLYFNFDSAGFDPNGRYILDIMYNGSSSWVADMMTQYNSQYNIGFSLTYNVHGCDSDYVPFRAQGYAAVMTHSEDHGAAHTPWDIVNYISTSYAKKNGMLGMAILAQLAGLQSVR